MGHGNSLDLTGFLVVCSNYPAKMLEIFDVQGKEDDLARR